MNLQIRDPRAHELAMRIARRRGVSMTDAVIAALEAELDRDAGRQPLATRVAEIAADLKAMARPGGRGMTKAEIDEMWGHV
jgi:antitoxin VapB